MKGTVVAAAVAALGGVEAANLRHRHIHRPAGLDKRYYGTDSAEQCECTTYTETIYGEPTLVGASPCTEEPTQAPTAQTVITTEVAVVPTPAVETCPTPGTYTFPATTMTVTETTTVCGASTTSVPAGHHTVGGVTTVVETETTVVCPYATTSVDDHGVVTSVIETTTYVCPSAGTYTIAPITTDCAEETVIVIPVVETYCPGTYTRDEVVTTITETDVVVVCPYTVSPVPEEPTEAPEPTEHVQPTEHVEAPEPTATQVVEHETTTAEEEPAETTHATTGGGSSGGSLGSSNDHWAMTYTPYTDDSLCKSQGQIAGDIAKIAADGFTAVRVYSTDCNTLEYVGDACRSAGIKMVIGIFINGGGCTNSNPTVPEQIKAIAAWAQWDMVETVVVGNEAMLNGYCTASEIAGLISECKSAFSGYSGGFTTAETLNIWQQDGVASALCGVIDVVGANIHPYFNPEVTAETAGDFVAGQLDLIDSICPGKTGINLECGWPSAGNCIGSACPGSDKQATAISDIRAKAGSRTCFFSYTNDLWKQPGSCGCEQSWGCGSLFSS